MAWQMRSSSRPSGGVVSREGRDEMVRDGQMGSTVDKGGTISSSGRWRVGQTSTLVGDEGGGRFKSTSSHFPAVRRRVGSAGDKDERCDASLPSGVSPPPSAARLVRGGGAASELFPSIEHLPWAERWPDVVGLHLSSFAPTQCVSGSSKFISHCKFKQFHLQFLGTGNAPPRDKRIGCAAEGEEHPARGRCGDTRAT